MARRALRLGMYGAFMLVIADLAAGCHKSTSDEDAAGWILVDKTIVGVGRINDETVVVIWFNDSGDGNVRLTGTDRRFVWQCRLHTHRGPVVDWSLTTADGRRGTVTIGNQSFELEKGACFTVKIDDAGLTVQQFRRDLRDVKFSSDYLREWASRDNVLSDFLNDSTK